MKGAASESLRLKRHCELPTPREICTPCQRNTYSVYPNKYVTRFKSATYVPRFKFFVFITKTLLFRLNHFCCRRFLPCLTSLSMPKRNRSSHSTSRIYLDLGDSVHQRTAYRTLSMVNLNEK